MTQTPQPPESSTPASLKARRSAGFATFRRRSVWTIFITAAVLLLLRLSLIFIFPAVLEHVLAYYNLTAGYNVIKLDVLGGDAEIWGLTVRPIKGGPDVMTVQYCHGNISVYRLFMGQLYIRRVVADGADVFVRRSVNGNCPLLHALLSHSGSTQTVASESGGNKSSISLAAPLRVEAFRIEHLRLHVIDHSVKPSAHLNITMNVRLSHLGRKHGASTFSLDLWSSAVVNVLHIDGSLTTGRSALLATSHIFMRGLHLQPTAGYLIPLGLQPRPTVLSLSADSTLALHVITSKSSGGQQIGAQFALHHFILSSGSRPALALQSLIAKGRLTGDLADVQTLSLDGVTLNAGRGKNGLLHFAGLELLRRIAAGNKRLRPTKAARPTVHHVPIHVPGLPNVKLKPASSYTYSIDRIELHDFKAVFRDAAVRPHATLQLTLKTLDALSTGGLPGSPGEKLAISGSGAAPGIAGTIHISGSMLPFAQTGTLVLHLAASQITCAALAPYLSAADLKSELKSARFHVDISGAMTRGPKGGVSANIHLDHLTYRDGKRALCDFKHIDAGKISVNPSTGRLEIGTLTIVGPAFNFVREPSGHFSVLGMQLLGKHSRSQAIHSPAVIKPTGKIAGPVPAIPIPVHSAAAYVLPRLQLDHLTWSGIRVGFDDQHATPATRIAISHAGMVLSNAVLDFSGQSAAHRSGTVKAWLQAPGLIGRIDLLGTLNPTKNSLQASIRVASTGIDLRPLQVYLKPLGILPLLRDGKLNGVLAARLSLSKGRMSGGVQVTNMRLQQAAQSLAAVQQLTIADIAARQGEFTAQSVLINKPYVHLSRLANGNLTLCGLELLPKKPVAINTSVPAAKAVNVPTPLRAAVKTFTLSDASVQWTDGAVFPHVNEHIDANVRLTNVFVGHRHPPTGTLQAVLSAPALAKAINIHGSFTMPPHSFAANILMHTTGLHGAVVNSYLPQGIAFVPRGETISTAIHVKMAHLADGSSAGTLGITNLNIIRAGHAAKPQNLLLLPRAGMNINAFNMAKHRVAISSIDVDLKTVHIARRPGIWSICGINIGKHLNVKPPSAIAAPAANIGAGKISVLSAQFPLVTLRHFQWHAGDILLTGLLSQDHPINITALDLRNTAPIRCLGTAPARNSAIALQLRARVNGMARNVGMAFNLNPFASNPRGKLHLLVTGIRGTGLAEVCPALAKYFDVHTLTHGQLSADGSLELQMARRSPIDFNFHRHFKASVNVSHVAFTAEPHGPILAGVTAIDAEKINVQPSRSAVTIALLNIRTPIFRITHDAAGLHILGMVLRSAPAGKPAAISKKVGSAKSKVKINVAIKTSKTGPTQAGSPTVPVTGKNLVTVAKGIKHAIKKLATVHPPATRAAANHPHFPAILIKRLIVSGIHAQYVDRTTTPNICLPMAGLEAQVRNLGTVPLMKRIPVRFNVIAYAGAVRALRPAAAASAGHTGKSGHAPRVPRTTRPAVRRPTAAPKALFSELAANGQLYMYPHLQGWSTLSLNGLYLAELAPLAKEYGMTLAGGTFNSSSDLRFHANKHIDLHTKLVFSNLNISEPAHGALEKWLNLPTPINVAIAAIEAPDGSITIPISVPINGDGLSRSALAGQISGDMGQVIAGGIASSPLKLANGLAGLFSSAKLKTIKEPPVKLGFAPGSIALATQDWARLQALGSRLQRDNSLQVIVRQQISTADVAVAALRANPTRSQCLQMIAGLQSRKNRLLIQRRKQVGTLRGDLAIRLSRAAINMGTARLARLDSKIARAQMALNYFANMLAPGASRQADRRTRGTMMSIARQRLAEIKAALFAAGFNHPNHRVHIVFPQYRTIKSTTGGNAVLTLVRTK